MNNFGIVIPVFNNIKYTKIVVKSLQETTNFDITNDLIIINNGSRDGTIEYIDSLGCLKIHNPDNFGVATAWNQGVKQFLDRKYIAILNNDIVLSNKWLDNIINFMDNNPKFINCSPAERAGINTRGNKTAPDTINTDVINVISEEEMLGSNGEAFKTHSEEYITKYGNLITPGHHGSCWVFNSEVFSKVGLFDEQFKIGFHEDTDFCWRMEEIYGKDYHRIVHASVYYHFCEKTISKWNQYWRGIDGNLYIINEPLTKNKKLLDEKWKGKR